MLAFTITIFVIGAALALCCTVRQFAAGSLVVVSAGLFYALCLGFGVGHALLGAVFLFACGQVGYVAGVAALTFGVARRTRRGVAAKRTRDSAKFDDAATRVAENGHGPISH